MVSFSDIVSRITGCYFSAAKKHPRSTSSVLPQAAPWHRLRSATWKVNPIIVSQCAMFSAAVLSTVLLPDGAVSNDSIEYVQLHIFVIRQLDYRPKLEEIPTEAKENEEKELESIAEESPEQKSIKQATMEVECQQPATKR